jgi:hypothetical protein
MRLSHISFLFVTSLAVAVPNIEQTRLDNCTVNLPSINTGEFTAHIYAPGPTPNDAWEYYTKGIMNEHQIDLSIDIGSQIHQNGTLKIHRAKKKDQYNFDFKYRQLSWTDQRDHCRIQGEEIIPGFYGKANWPGNATLRCWFMC